MSRFLARVRIILFWFYFTFFYFMFFCFFSELWLSFPVGLFLRFPLHFDCFIFVLFLSLFLFVFLLLFCFFFVSVFVYFVFSLPMYFCCWRMYVVPVVPSSRAWHCVVECITMHYLCVVACDHRADLSRVKNQSVRTLGVLDVDE